MHDKYLLRGTSPDSLLPWWSDPAKFFLALGLLFGVSLVVFLPPHQVADEWRHFYRVWQLADGHLLGNGMGDEIPEAIQQLTDQTEDSFGIPTKSPVPWRHALHTLRQMGTLRVEEGRASYATFPTVLYAPIPYVGMVVAVALARICTDSSLLLLYFGRLGGCLLATILTWRAIKIMPFGRWAFVLIAMTPVLAFQRVGLSADGLINSLAMFHVALILHALSIPPGQFGGKEVIRIGIVTGSLCLCKQAYLILPLLNWLIPGNCFSSSNYRRMVRFWFPILGWLLAVWWASMVMAGHYEPMRTNCDAKLQFLWVMEHPLSFFLVIWQDLLAHCRQYLHELVGTLGHLDLPAAHYLVLTHTVLLIAVCLFDRDGSSVLPSPSMRWICLSIFIASLILVCGLMYLWWAPVGALELPGMQGRYFSPFLPLLPLLLVLPKPEGLHSLHSYSVRDNSLLACIPCQNWGEQRFAPNELSSNQKGTREGLLEDGVSLFRLKQWISRCIPIYAICISFETLFRTLLHHYC